MALSSRQEAEKEAVQLRLGRNLAQIRNHRGITQEKFSFMLGVDRTYISYIERGERNPSLYLLYRMAKALKVGLGDLMDI